MHYIIPEIIRRNVTMILVRGVMDTTPPTLHDTVLTQHVISSSDVIDLGGKSVRHFQIVQFLIYANNVI